MCKVKLFRNLQSFQPLLSPSSIPMNLQLQSPVLIVLCKVIICLLQGC